MLFKNLTLRTKILRLSQRIRWLEKNNVQLARLKMTLKHAFISKLLALHIIYRAEVIYKWHDFFLDRKKRFS